MIDKPIDALRFEDIASQVANRVREDRSLDYKEQLPGNNDEARRDFLGDVASFANTTGGHVLFGVSEERDSIGQPTGIPNEAIGLPGNLDAAILTLESATRDGIDPRIPSIRWRPIPGGRSGDILVCWIPKSWQAPHMVTFRGLSRFYARGSNGKYQLDVRQIREAFISSEGLREKIRGFRLDRLAKIASDDTPVRLEKEARVVLQIIPLATFDDAAEQSINLDLVLSKSLFGSASMESHYNFDGVLAFRRGRVNCYDFVQVFRNGTIEYVGPVSGLSESKAVASLTFERDLISRLKTYLQDLGTFGVQGPLLVVLSFVGMMGWRMAKPSNWIYMDREPGPIDRDVLPIPEVWLEQIPTSPTVEEAARILHGPLDVLWQASGWQRSPYFSEDGRWGEASTF